MVLMSYNSVTGQYVPVGPGASFSQQRDPNPVIGFSYKSGEVVTFHTPFGTVTAVREPEVRVAFLAGSQPTGVSIQFTRGEDHYLSHPFAPNTIAWH